MEDSCEVCRYCVRLSFVGDAGTMEEFYCHRYPPTVDTQKPESPGLWPVVEPESWCGEFVPDNEEEPSA